MISRTRWNFFLWNITKAPLLKSTEWTETFIKDSKGLGRKPKKKEKTKKVYENKEKTKIKNPPQLFFLKLVVSKNTHQQL